MKKGKRIISVFLSVSIVFSCMLSSAASTDAIYQLKPKVLNTYERVNASGEELQVKIADYQINTLPEINNEAKSMLDSFDIKHDSIQKAEKIRDTVTDKDLYRVESESAEIDYDEQGNVVRFLNKEDLHPVRDTSALSAKLDTQLVAEEYIYNSSEDLQDIINKIVKENELQDYTLVRCDNDLVGTWTLNWNKNLGNSVVNPYDVVVAIIDAKDGSIITYTRNVVTPNTTTPIVTSKQAIQLSKPIINKLSVSTDNIDTKLTVFRPNFYFEENGPYEVADFVRLAWQVVINNGLFIYVDAETGEILGGNQTQESAWAASVVPDTNMNNQCASYANSGLKKLGYSDCHMVTSYIQQADANWILKDYYEPNALYLRCHGGQNSVYATLTDNVNWTIPSYQMRNGWRFVFLDACLSSLTNNSGRNFFVDSMDMGGWCKAFVGWNIKVHQTISYYFDVQFWSRVNVGTISIYDVVLQASAVVQGWGYDCNPGFWGDLAYDGHNF